MPGSPSSFGGGGRELPMQEVNEKSRSNIRLAIILGLVAFGFFLMGMYLAVGREG